MVEINRVSVDYIGVVDQLIGGEIIEFDTRFQNGVKLSSSSLLHFVVNGRYTNKHPCDCEQAIFVFEPIL
jgi:hypothetical protein